MIRRNWDPTEISQWFVVQGNPVPKARARAKFGQHHYTPKATVEYEKRIGAAWDFARSKIEDPWESGHTYVVTVVAYFSDKRRRDLDNVLKSVLDGLNGKAWDDDSQVDEMRIMRQYDKESPRTTVLVERIL